ncbi:MAG TPA: cation diffusion facilitator family transporter [Nitrososphaeraceae archaeon]|nr:cation diffusion facilitator family transporter [Nitrososphaeraceae archaeon]
MHSNVNDKKYHHNHAKKLKIVLIITISFLIVEVIIGIFANSLALIANAIHMFTDVAGIGLALVAINFSSKKSATAHKTYGFYRLEILTALINSTLILIFSFYIIYEAYWRLFEQNEIKGLYVFVIATIGLIVNLIGIKILHRHAKENINVEGAYLEVLKDMYGSCAVIVASLIIISTNLYIVDPIVSIGLSLFIIPRTWSLMKRVVNILMEGVPSNISYEQVKKSILEIKGVTGIFDLHLWTITSGFDAMTAHVVISDVSKSQIILNEINSILEKKFNITHNTIQIETYHE